MPRTRRATCLSFVVMLFVTLLVASASAETSVVAGPSPDQEPETIVADVLIETLSAHKLAIAVDRYQGLEGPDGILDELLVFMSDAPLEPLTEHGLGLLRVDGGRATLVLPRSRVALFLSLSDLSSPTAPASTGGFTRHVLDQGTALVIHRPAEPQTPEEALVAEIPRRRADMAGDGNGLRRRAGLDWMPETKDDGSGGETCGSACSKTCTDGSSCSTTCNATQCAVCDCPASCYCRTRN
jgi:hypothetical protein